MVGNVIKIDLKIDKGARGQFARFAVQVDLRKPLVSRIRIASRVYKVEYESLPTGMDRLMLRNLLDWINKKVLDQYKKGLRMKGEGQECITESIIKATNGRQLNRGIKGKVSKGKGHKKWVVGVKGQGTKQTMSEPKMEKLGDGNEEIGPKVGYGLRNFSANVHNFKENQNPNVIVGFYSLMEDDLGIKNLIPYSTLLPFLKEKRSNNTLSIKARGHGDNLGGLDGMVFAQQVIQGMVDLSEGGGESYGCVKGKH
ncbi:hypothetical protein PVK06_012480 [Gossypium arboreum]|uniref:Uncharacterized protein n=1 Tax=Gossypium arboreum TaxID=29729 RepID=A0ABR0QBL3_GOSAR|nr:hypothetical protein PVK06_012480 [Gossypium arboreum]